MITRYKRLLRNKLIEINGHHDQALLDYVVNVIDSKETQQNKILALSQYLDNHSQPLLTWWDKEVVQKSFVQSGSDVFFPNLFQPDPDPTDQMAAFGSTTTTVEQLRNGQDIQGIPWATLLRTRGDYRTHRLNTYQNYTNTEPTAEEVQRVKEEVQRTSCLIETDSPNSDNNDAAGGGRKDKYAFHFNTRAVRPSYVHFQLRHLVWSTSPYDVYMLSEQQPALPHQHAYGIMHWDALSKTSKQALDLSSEMFATDVRRPIQLSTMALRESLLVVGGFLGELICVNLANGTYYCNKRITVEDNSITNAIETCVTRSGALQVVTSNNDCCVRTFDVPSFRETTNFKFPWAINHTSPSKDVGLLCVVGDMTAAYIMDPRSGREACRLEGHLDFSFASSWHPNGYHLATGNQDKTCRVWDLRKPTESLAVIEGRIAAIRSLRYNQDGSLLGMAEAADFVHLVDTTCGYEKRQTLDVFGEIAGFSFSPEGESLFLGVSDGNFGSLLEYHRSRDSSFGLH